MFNNIRGILNRKGEQSKSPEGLSSRGSSEDNVENNASSAEGFLCPTCFLAFPTPEALQNHYESSHFENEVTGDKRGFNCPACKMKLGSEIELKSHYTRHHTQSGQKDEMEIESMALQVKALEEGKSLLKNELQELSKENTRIREERDNFKLEATKLTDDMAKLNLQFEEVKTKKTSLKSSMKQYEDKIRKLEVEMHQRPEADDVKVLQENLVSVQTMMNALTRQREEERDLLQKQFNTAQETCLKLQSEKAELENAVKSFPKKEEMQRLQERVSELSKNISSLQQELNEKEIEKMKLQADLEKCANYQEIKTMLSEKNNALQEIQRQADEKDALIGKLKNDLKTYKENIEEMKIGREKLFSKIEEGEGANAAMLQLNEENARLREQFTLQQQIHCNEVTETETKMEDLRSSLKNANAALEASGEKCSELGNIINHSQKQFEELQNQKDQLIKELKSQTESLTLSETECKSQVNDLKDELNNRKKLVDQHIRQLESLKEQMKKDKIIYEQQTVQMELQKQDFEKRLFELGERAKADLLDRESKLLETERKFQQLSEKLEATEKEKTNRESEFQQMQESCKNAKIQLEIAEKTAADFEATKVEFCDKISSLSEERLQNQLKESELMLTIEKLHKDHSQLIEKYSILEEENKSLRSSTTTLQNEKNSLLSDLEKHKNALHEFNEICAANERTSERKINELTESYDKLQVHTNKVEEDARIEKEVYVKDKLRLQKQIECLENDCAKQLSQIQETVKDLETKLNEAEEQNSSLQTSLEERKKFLKQKDLEWEEKAAHHTAQVGLLTGNIQTLRADLNSEQQKRKTVEQKLDEVCGTKLELEAKLENALQERGGLIERYLKCEAECERLQKSATDLRRKYEDSVAALQELGRENQTLQVENLKHVTRKWTEDAEVTHCTACGKLFTVTIRKHHCRNCGSIFCNECSAKTATVAASKKPVRVCDICFNEVTK